MNSAVIRRPCHYFIAMESIYSNTKEVCMTIYSNAMSGLTHRTPIHPVSLHSDFATPCPSPAQSRTLVDFFAVPICVLCTWIYVSNEIVKDREPHTFVANFKLVIVSLRCASSGLIITNMRVLELPPREYCNRYVNYFRSA